MCTANKGAGVPILWVGSGHSWGEGTELPLLRDTCVICVAGRRGARLCSW